jgi:hypothetical protein
VLKKDHLVFQDVERHFTLESKKLGFSKKMKKTEEKKKNAERVKTT